MVTLLKKILQRLKFIRKTNLSHYVNIEGWLTSAEATGLFQIAERLLKNSTVLEIGSWKGKSTWCISQGLKKGTLHCIDPFNAAGEEGSKEIYEKTKGNNSLLEQFQNNMKGISEKVKITTHKGYSSDFVDAIPNIDFLFIDGDHSIEGCRFNYENFENEVKVGGFLAFHDYYPDRVELGSTWVIQNLVKQNKNYIHYNDFDSLSVFKKI